MKKPVFVGDLCHQLNLITLQLKTTVDSQKRCVLREKTWAYFHQAIQKGIPEYNDYLRLDSRVSKVVTFQAFKLGINIEKKYCLLTSNITFMTWIFNIHI
jgi:hypothetical protein